LTVTLTNAGPGVVVGTPLITSLRVQGGTNVVIAGANVASGAHPYYILGTTNAATMRSNWLPVLTNTCSGDGSGSFSNSLPVSGGLQFFLIEVPTP
jgi:hypothetical protein